MTDAVSVPHERAYRLGWSARHAGKALKKNPYRAPKAAGFANAWHAGWCRADRDLKGAADEVR